MWMGSAISDQRSAMSIDSVDEGIADAGEAGTAGCPYNNEG
jgi:hypothetical protein